MSKSIYQVYLEAIASVLDGRGLVSDYYSVSHSRKKGLYQATFGSFSALKQIYRTRPRAPHVNHDLSFLYECLCIVLWWEESGFGLIFSLKLTKKFFFFFFRILFSGYFGSFTAIELLYRTRLRAPHVKRVVYNSFWRPFYWALALAVGVQDSRKTKRDIFSSGPRTTERGNANGVSELKKEKERYQLLVQVLKNFSWIIVELFTLNSREYSFPAFRDTPWFNLEHVLSSS